MTFPALEKVAPQVTPQVEDLIKILDREMNRLELQEKLNLSDRKHFRIHYLKPALEAGLIEMTKPEIPNSRSQTFKKSTYKSLGIICKTKMQAQEITEKLKSYTDDLYFLSHQSTAFAKGIIVTSSHMAKGLEFDEVIIPQANDTNYNTLIDKSMLYVAATRAMHKLTITHWGKHSQFIP